MKTRYLLILLATLILLNAGLYTYYVIFRGKATSVTYLCPVPKKYCKTGKIVELEGQYMGIGYEIPQNTSMLAVMNGTTRGGKFSFNPKIAEGQYPMIIISSGKSIEVDYIFPGDDYTQIVEVRQGEEIGKSASEAIKLLDVNLLVRVRQISEGKSEIIKLSPTDFK